MSYNNLKQIIAEIKLDLSEDLILLKDTAPNKHLDLISKIEDVIFDSYLDTRCLIQHTTMLIKLVNKNPQEYSYNYSKQLLKFSEKINNLIDSL